MPEGLHPLLRPTAGDQVEKALRALTSAVDALAPGWGGFFGELIGSVIPNTASHRTAELLTRVSRRLQHLEVKVDGLTERLGPEQIALFEDGARSAIKATSVSRIERLARVVAHGLAANDAEAEKCRVIIQILDQLSEPDLIKLDGYVWRGGRNPRLSDFPPRAEDAGTEQLPVAEQMQRAVVAREQKEDQKALELHRVTKLINLNLLSQTTTIGSGRPALGGRPTLPVITTDQPKLTRLGALVLDHAGLGQPTWEGVFEREREAAEWIAKSRPGLTPDR